MILSDSRRLKIYTYNELSKKYLLISAICLSAWVAATIIVLPGAMRASIWKPSSGSGKSALGYCGMIWEDDREIEDLCTVWEEK
jgi:hypothetical protein